MENIEIGLKEARRNAVIEQLGRVLGNQHVLYIKLRNFHWNLVGERFHTLHEFYEEQYNELATDIDETAERIRMLGGVAPGTMKSLLSHAELQEAEAKLIDGTESIKQLVADHEQCIRSLRGMIPKIEEDHGDVGTADFLTGLIQKHESAAWMLRSFLR